jgi:hypothetical protein
VKVRAEALGVTGSFGNGDDISAFAGYAGLEYPVNESFNPFVALRVASGDDDPTDNDVEGWLGITDIGRFSPLIGIDGQFLGWEPNSNQAIASGLFGLALDQAGPGGAWYFQCRYW